MKTLTALILAGCLANCCPTIPASSEASSAPPADPVKHVVLVHGFLERGSNFKMLRERLEKRQVHCLVPRLTPSDGRTGIDALARQLKEAIDEEFGPERQISVVGFSMGGLISRYYLQNLGGAERCEQLITVASPHNGTFTAYLYPGRGTQQMRPGSEFLSQLARSENRLGSMPVTSYRTPLDLIILPTTSPVWPRAENLSHCAPLHPLMLNIPPVLSDIERRLLEELP